MEKDEYMYINKFDEYKSDISEFIDYAKNEFEGKIKKRVTDYQRGASYNKLCKELNIVTKGFSKDDKINAINEIIKNESDEKKKNSLEKKLEIIKEDEKESLAKANKHSKFLAEDYKAKKRFYVLVVLQGMQKECKKIQENIEQIDKEIADATEKLKNSKNPNLFKTKIETLNNEKNDLENLYKSAPQKIENFTKYIKELDKTKEPFMEFCYTNKLDGVTKEDYEEFKEMMEKRVKKDGKDGQGKDNGNKKDDKDGQGKDTQGTSNQPPVSNPSSNLPTIDPNASDRDILKKYLKMSPAERNEVLKNPELYLVVSSALSNSSWKLTLTPGEEDRLRENVEYDSRALCKDMLKGNLQEGLENIFSAVNMEFSDELYQKIYGTKITSKFKGMLNKGESSFEPNLIYSLKSLNKDSLSTLNRVVSEFYDGVKTGRIKDEALIEEFKKYIDMPLKQGIINFGASSHFKRFDFGFLKNIFSKKQKSIISLRRFYSEAGELKPKNVDSFQSDLGKQVENPDDVRQKDQQKDKEQEPKKDKETALSVRDN